MSNMTYAEWIISSVKENSKEISRNWFFPFVLPTNARNLMFIVERIWQTIHNRYCSNVHLYFFFFLICGVFLKPLWDLSLDSVLVLILFLLCTGSQNVFLWRAFIISSPPIFLPVVNRTGYLFPIVRRHLCAHTVAWTSGFLPISFIHERAQWHSPPSVNPRAERRAVTHLLWLSENEVGRRAASADSDKTLGLSENVFLLYWWLYIPSS